MKPREVVAFGKVFLVPTLALWAVPLLTVLFVGFAQPRLDTLVPKSADLLIDEGHTLTVAQREALRAFYLSHATSQVCEGTAPEQALFREAVCGVLSPTWQLHWASQLGMLGLVLGLVALVAVALLGALAWWRPRAQYAAFMVGWRLLVLLTATETVLQGALVVWLFFWGFVALTSLESLKLLVLAFFVAGVTVVNALMGLFAAPPGPDALEALVIKPADAPSLWARIQQLAARLNVTPPTVLLAGIDDNFFVSEQPAPLAQGGRVAGRVLYVSLPLLRVLSPTEADAVLAHELAHFAAGDTEQSARLGPALARYAVYVRHLADAALTRPAAAVMRLFWVVCGFSFAREARARELAADAVAASLTSADDVGRALIKVVSYASYRVRVQGELFAAQTRHEGALTVGAVVDQGLAAHVASSDFLEQVRLAQVPHPFDSHPPLLERTAALGSTVSLEAAPSLLQQRPASSWVDDVTTAADIEQSLWASWEERFKARHSLSLIYRYLPKTDEERAVVVRAFPDRTFGEGAGSVTVSHVGLYLSGGGVLRFADLEAAKVSEGAFSDTLELILREGGAVRTVKVSLKPFEEQAELFKSTLRRYWQRDQAARAWASGG
jgi:Zn-dependent protease with chaperone function